MVFWKKGDKLSKARPLEVLQVVPQMQNASILRLLSISMVVLQLETGAVIQTSVKGGLDLDIFEWLSQVVNPQNPVPCRVILGEYQLSMQRFHESELNFGTEFAPKQSSGSKRMNYKKRNLQYTHISHRLNTDYPPAWPWHPSTFAPGTHGRHLAPGKFHLAWECAPG